MTFPVAAGCFGCESMAFIPAVPLAPADLARRSPRQSGFRSGWSSLPLCAVQPQGGEPGKGDGEDIANLYRVTPVPTYEEMLAWAEETDQRIAAGRLPPSGSRQPSPAVQEAGAAGGSLLSEQEEAQMETLSRLLSKRRRGSSPLPREEETALRAAMAGLSSSVDGTGDESFDGAASSTDPGGDGDGEVAPDGAGADDLVRNEIYGSREVRDKVYLYAWSLMKNRQDKAERDAEEQERQRQRCSHYPDFTGDERGERCLFSAATPSPMGL